MSNTLGVYNPIFYAQEALIQLEKSLGMAARVHRGFDEERRAFGYGETINIRRPSTFTAQDAPSVAQNVDTGTVALTLSYWKEVKFKLTDRELAFTGNRIIEDHIRPAAYALADDIDQKLSGLYKDVPWFYDIAAAPGSTVPADITGVRKIMFDNSVPVYDAGRMHYMVNGALEQGFLQLSAFSQQQGAGDVGINTQMRGSLGMKYGFEMFANQNVPSHTKGTASTGTLAVDGDTAAGATTITLDAVSVTGTLVPGDTFVIAGNTQRYSVTNTVTAAANSLASVTFTPPLVAQAANDAVVTVSLDDHTANLAFHRNAFALAMAPLSEMGNELGARIATVTDPVSGLSLRSRLYYVGNSSEVHVSLDVLYGVKTLDPNLACRARG
jgi:hypothetical protein